MLYGFAVEGGVIGAKGKALLGVDGLVIDPIRALVVEGSESGVGWMVSHFVRGTAESKGGDGEKSEKA